MDSLKPSFIEEYLSLKTSRLPFGENTVFCPVSLEINEPKPWLDRLSYDVIDREQENISNEAATNEILPSVTSSISSSIYTKKLLQDRLRTVLQSRNNTDGLSQQEFCNLVFENLISNQTDDEIQSSLCDIIGFDHLELISEFIQNRQMIIEGILNSTKTRPREIVRMPELIQRQTQPIHGPSVIIQSEQEKRLEKQLRKQGRKQQQQQNESNDFLNEFSSPELLRYERERQLLLATTRRYEKLSNTSPSNSFQINTKYPFVFDQLQEIKQKAAYIGGRNLLLPENIERKSTTIYDLVHIPHGEQIKVANLGKHISREFIRYEDLEPLGQVLFKDRIKTLNLVQSIVYQTAAFSNENILISAP